MHILYTKAQRFIQQRKQRKKKEQIYLTYII